MEFYLLNDELAVVGIIDRITHARVTRNFFAPGEISVSAAERVCVPDSARYIYEPGEGCCAVIEKTVYPAGGGCTVSGRSAEALFERQVLKREGYLYGSVATALEVVLLTYAPANGAFPDLAVGNITGLPDLDVIPFEWKDLSHWFYDTLARFGASYRLDMGDFDSFFTFNVVFGTDRSSFGDGKSYVLIREDGDCLENVSFSVDTKGYSNVICVVGNDGRYVTVPDNAPSGLDRREGILFARDVYPASFETDEEYLSVLRARGESRIASYSERITFSGRASGNGMYRFGRDYFLGDICDIETKSGQHLALRVVSVTDTYENGVVLRDVRFGGDISSSAVIEV